MGAKESVKLVVKPCVADALHVNRNCNLCLRCTGTGGSERTM